MARQSGPKPDALPGCATPRHPEAPSFSAVSGQAESSVRGNEWQNEAGTGEQTPGIVPNPDFEKPLTANPDISGVSGDCVGETGVNASNTLGVGGGTVTRPVLRWHGGKWLLAPWIISHFPKHQVYVEPFGGAGSVLIRKERTYAEIYNDLDQSVVNLFRVLRSGRALDLVNSLRLTPFARDEFREAYEVCADPVEMARRLVIRSFMGFGSNGHNKLTGFRANSNRSGTTPAHDWINYPESLAALVERLRGVTVENKDAKAVMAQHDGADTLHYVDPPYVMATRADEGSDYAFEMTDDQHVELLTFLRGLRGMVVLSGYPCDLYDNALSDWRRVEREALADGAKKRTEVLWINPAAASAVSAGPLFEGIVA